MEALQETIRPSADLRNHYNEISKLCRENREAVIITVNGRGDTVSLSYELYKQIIIRLGMFEMLAESERDYREGNVYPMAETFGRLKSFLAEE